MGWIYKAAWQGLLPLVLRRGSVKKLFEVVKRDGEVAEFNLGKINDAIAKAFEATGKAFNDDIIGLYYDIDNLSLSPSLAYENENLLYMDVSGIDTSKLTLLDTVFYDCPKLERIDGLENWDVSNVEEFKYVFWMLPSLTDVSGV